MARKYLRGLQYITGTNGRDIPIFMRFCYEFWGYCVNGTSSLTTPGGMPTSPTSGPVGFFEGASVIATGNDGVTSDLGINFTSLSGSFNPSMIGKHITIWSHTDPDSTDNSIYRILNVVGATQMQISPFSGGTRDITTMKNNLTSRSALNYRIIDVVAASQLSINTDNYFVGTLSDGYTVNVGQASSQFQFKLKGSSTPFGQFNMVGSPTGTWVGTTIAAGSNSVALPTGTINVASTVGFPSSGTIFVTTATTTATVTYTGTNATQFTGCSGGSGTMATGGSIGQFTGTILTEQTLPTNNYTGTTSSASGTITLIADKTFMLGHIKSENSNISPDAGMYFYVIIPQRLYTQAQDPNPLTILVGGNNLITSVGTDSHSTKFHMIYSDNVTRACQLMTKNFVGDGTTGTAYTFGPNLSPFLATQNRTHRALYTEAIISNNAVAGHFALARAKLTQIAFTSSIFPSFHLFGDNGEFIHIGNGVLWPWDGSVMTYNLLPLGT